jgi:hypothetical protein
MVALTDVTPLRHRGKPSQIEYVVNNGSVIYPGALVALNAAGFLIPYAGQSVGVRVLGIANDGDTKTGTAAGDVSASVDVAGVLLEQITVTGVTGQTDLGLPVYGLTDNVNDLTITQVPTQGAVGMITRFHSGTTVDVWLFEASQIPIDA